MSEVLFRRIILDELEFEPSVDAAHIGVSVDKGVVILTGYVNCFAEKQATIAAVRRIKGVRAIAEEMEVRYPFEKKVSDDDIAKRAVDILSWDVVVPSRAIQVLVRDGWVTLAGNVDWYFQMQSAEGDIRKLSGVRGVTNNINIRPRVSAVDVKKKIEGALRRRLEGEVSGIRITVEDGNKVLLEGFVESWNERHAVEIAAWSAPGVKAVDDRLSVGT